MKYNIHLSLFNVEATSKEDAYQQLTNAFTVMGLIPDFIIDVINEA